MRDGWKAVSKEEFDVLSKYHPSEIRYFINLKEVGASRRAAEEIEDANRKYKRRVDFGIQRGAGLQNRKLALGVGTGQEIQSMYQAKVFSSIRKFMKDDLKAGLERGKIVASVVNDTGMGKNQVQPIITRLIEGKFLRYVD